MGWYRYILLRTSVRARTVVDRLIRLWSRGDARPAFYDVDQVMPELRRIDENYDVIREELMRLLPRAGEIPRYHHIDQTQSELSDDDGAGWRILYLFLDGAPVQPNEEYCPRTVEILKGLPRTMGAFFSVLEPGKSIAPHRGPSLANIRYHTAFVVPEENPPTLRVKDEYHTWQEGVSILFDDSLPHSVKNESDAIRVVLIVDVWRPLLPWILDAANRFIGWCWRNGTSEEQWMDAVRDRTLVPTER